MIQCESAIQLRRVAIDDKLQVVVFHLDRPSKHVIHFPAKGGRNNSTGELVLGLLSTPIASGPKGWR